MSFELGCGTIALCSRGNLGLITMDKPITVRYSDGSTAEAWVGIHLTSGIGNDSERNLLRFLPGDPWSSRNPTPVGHVSQFEE